MTQGNTTFVVGTPTWANACVGENGFPDYWDYAKGFSQAAVLLINTALQGRGLKHSVDELVYPVCFNMRHSVELRLKGAITELSQIEEFRARKLDFDLVRSHDVGNIWSFFVEISKMVDDRYIPIIARLDKKISDFAEVDATGQTFRYPLNTESQKHLVDVSIINFVQLKRSFSFLESALDELHCLNKYLCREYAWGTFTKNLSRKNLFELVSLLPPRHTWSDESFDIVRNRIKEKFKIGSKELSDSIKIIETHFEFAPLIEMSMPLLGVIDSDIDEFFRHWFKQHNLPSDTDPIDLDASEWEGDAIFESIDKDSRIHEEVWRLVKPNLTPEKMAGLSSLFYFGHEPDFSEHYQDIFELNLREAKAANEDSEVSFRSKFFHIYDKTNAVYNILRSLYFLRRPESADHLVTSYNLNQKFSWLDEARSRSLFSKPDYCGYSI